MTNPKNMTGLVCVRKCQTPNWIIQHYNQYGDRQPTAHIKIVTDSRGRRYKVMPAGNLKRV